MVVWRSFLFMGHFLSVNVISALTVLYCLHVFSTWLSVIVPSRARPITTFHVNFISFVHLTYSECFRLSIKLYCSKGVFLASIIQVLLICAMVMAIRTGQVDLFHSRSLSPRIWYVYTNKLVLWRSSFSLVDLTWYVCVHDAKRNHHRSCLFQIITASYLVWTCQVFIIACILRSCFCYFFHILRRLDAQVGHNDSYRSHLHWVFSACRIWELITFSLKYRHSEDASFFCMQASCLISLHQGHCDIHWEYSFISFLRLIILKPVIFHKYVDTVTWPPTLFMASFCGR